MSDTAGQEAVIQELSYACGRLKPYLDMLCGVRANVAEKPGPVAGKRVPIAGERVPHPENDCASPEHDCA